MNRIGVFGANGRMGLALVEAAHKNNHAELGAAYVRSSSPLLNIAVNQLNSAAPPTVNFSDERSVENIDVLIDFTLPAGMREHLKTAVAQNIPMVIGTTGLNDDDMLALQTAAKQIPIVFARNYSVGVNLLLNLVQTAATKFGDDLDIEIFEAHHRHKIDAPSGTALAIGEAIADAKGWVHDEVAVFDRSRVETEKSQNEIGYSVLRGGDIVGEHTAYFATSGERLELTHKASSRMTFALGAVRAAGWLKNKPAGLYDMQDVLDLK
ncbi:MULTISPECIES: 4-hydroxy-tetrahydrodipicolinate reductase [Pseudoalteromonas]|uniref:4-hydroxy-tetrahydrodipicolinate reductase n=1 Tax=Pseudoalteromonas TaxID=53246 RepID=UPI00160153E7|nr:MULTISPECIES: 4-hydroxy-tetrahydrodipicolinate reductase [unclassified Pseudoalteromonas]MBB1435663.1 4-hydroxy-tetrahydrodipicolinate reductase [Pseudoalteromonas sp. SG43-6]MBB1478001.1 4-hydroxy-tetrahydrodipicolinate reductase [Pseudoalteromonas sp. SG41-2]